MFDFEQILWKLINIRKNALNKNHVWYSKEFIIAYLERKESFFENIILFHIFLLLIFFSHHELRIRIKNQEARETLVYYVNVLFFILTNAINIKLIF